MNEESMTLKKKIKRHVSKRVNSFFACVLPGFENFTLNELKSLPLTIKDAAITKGGVEFKGYINDCYVTNLLLRSSNRILMRLITFNAFNFKQLSSNIIDFPWELYITKEAIPKIHATTRSSVLYHKGAIADCFLESIEKRLNYNINTLTSFTNSYEQNLFIRVVNNEFMVSIDSSGEMLYKRGIKKCVGNAPIRETIASWILKEAGYNGKVPIIDAMCGSGTFSIEAAMISKNIPAGLFRNFTFMKWPCFNNKDWDDIVNQSKSKIITFNTPEIFASDIDDKMCRLLNDTIKEFSLDDIVNVSCRNFFDLDLCNLTEEKGLIVLNPPYGFRISRQDDLVTKIFEHIQRYFQGWKFAIVLPDEKNISSFIKRKANRSFKLMHGGIKLNVLFGS
ncbi:MAG: hypothetical protein HQK76_06945 [Desulfobacterales bacterium]|nr:hypothetical protein [Desulfobacterales bacterium]